MSTEKPNESESTRQPPAPMLEIVRIHTPKFRCLAYRDTEGRWWDKNHNPVTEPVLFWEKI